LGHIVREIKPVHILTHFARFATWQFAWTSNWEEGEKKEEEAEEEKEGKKMEEKRDLPSYLFFSRILSFTLPSSPFFFYLFRSSFLHTQTV